jgi:hypothetical protein
VFVFQFTVECEWQRQEAQTVSVSVPHVLSFGTSLRVIVLVTLQEERFGEL